MYATLERTSNGVAYGAIMSPVWLPYVQTLSDTAALALPILGAAWLIIQMISHFKRKK